MESIYDESPRMVTRRERAVLLTVVLVIAVCALTYELVVATLSSYLLGDSVTQFSFTIGFFLFAMGVGSLLSRRIKHAELRWFIIVELLVALSGGTSAVLLYAVFATASIYYHPVMIAVSLAIGICVGLEIPLLTRIVANRSELSDALADVLSVDYLGALVASLAFPVVLLPLLGVTTTAFLMGLFNVLVASICLYIFRHRLRRKWQRRLGALAGAVSLLMLAGVATSMNIVRLFEQRLYVDPIIYDTQSPYQRVILTSTGSDVRMYIDGNLQFSTLDEHRYHEMLVHPAMSMARSHERILVLGGGDGLVARQLLKYDSVQEIIIVDLDLAITQLARENSLLRRINDNALNDPRVSIINDDAFRYVQESETVFPVVIIDLPDPNNESLSKLYSREFYTLLMKRLSPDGVMITQATSPYFARRSYWTIAHTIESAGFHILPLRAYIPTFGEWGFVIGTPKRPPQPAVPDVPDLRYITPDVLTAAQLFDPDTDRVQTEVNTLDHPVLPRTYEQDWQLWD